MSTATTLRALQLNWGVRKPTSLYSRLGVATNMGESSAADPGALKRSPSPSPSSLLPVLVGGVLALLGGVIGAYLQGNAQNRLFARQFAISVRQQRQQESIAAFREMTAALDRPMQSALRVIEEAQEGASTDSLSRLIQRFEDDRNNWGLSFNHVRLLATVYFGDTAEKRILEFNSRLMSVDTIVRDALQVRTRLANTSGLPQALITNLRRVSAEELQASQQTVAAEVEYVYSSERLWSAEIQARKAGTIDPLAPFDEGASGEP